MSKIRKQLLIETNYMKNIKAENVDSFKELIAMYEELLKKGFKIRKRETSFQAFSRHTGFGTITSCILCKELIRKGFAKTFLNPYTPFTDVINTNCSKCIYKIATNYKCNLGGNKETYYKIYDAVTKKDIIEAIEERLRNAKNVLKTYYKMKKRKKKFGDIIIKEWKDMDYFERTTIIVLLIVFSIFILTY